MSKYVLRLTDELIKQAVPKDKIYKLFDGAGLYIAVQPSGSKVWRMKYLQQSGGESVLTFGRYPEVSIAKAREHRLAAHKLLERQQDPHTEFNREKLHPLPKPIPIDEIFDEPEWVHVQTSIRRATLLAIRHLETALFPALQRISISEAQHSIQQAAIRQIEQAGLQVVSGQLEGVATALAASYLRNGISMDQLVSAMKESRRRVRRQGDNMQ